MFQLNANNINLQLPLPGAERSHAKKGKKYETGKEVGEEGEWDEGSRTGNV